MKTSHSAFSSPRYLRLLLVVIAIASCLLVIQAAARYGFSSLLVEYALITGNLTAAQKAIQVAPKDPDAHFTRAALLSLSGTPEQAIPEMERAAALRPADYGFWAELGLLRDQTGDPAGAVKAFDEAVKRAPFYSQPRWNRGNVLLRSGQSEAAFNDLRQAAQSNPALVPNLMELAWGISRGDVKLAEQLADINNQKLRIAFAQCLARHGKAQEALAQLRAAGDISEKIKVELIKELLAKKAFKEAFVLSNGTNTDSQQTGPVINDGGFESPLAFGGSGFGWRVPHDLEATSVLLDSSQPHSGGKNLTIDFAGNSNPDVSLVSQLILVEPSKRYKVNFASRSHEVVSGGLPLIVATDATGAPKRLGESAPLAKETTNWQVYSFEFATTSQTAAVFLTLQRENCTTSPCPIFGSISLDSFSVEQLR